MFLGGTEAIIRSRVDGVHPLQKYVRLFRETKSANVVFGDSMAAGGFTGVAGFVNLAREGDTFPQIDRKVRLYFAQRRPDRVIIEAGLHHFSQSYLASHDDDEFPRQLAGQGYGLKVFEGVYRAESLTYWKLALTGQPFVPKYGFESDGARLKDTRFSQEAPATRQVTAVREAAGLLPVPAARRDRLWQGYAEMVRFLRDKGARVCLVAFPYAPEMQAAIAAHPQYGEVRAGFADLARRTGAVYVDLIDAPLGDELFENPTHLNGFGAHLVAPDMEKRCFE